MIIKLPASHKEETMEEKLRNWSMFQNLRNHEQSEKTSEKTKEGESLGKDEECDKKSFNSLKSLIL